MRGRTFDPRHLDVESFAERAAVLDGSFPLVKLGRLLDSTHTEAPTVNDDAVAWQATGERRTRRGRGFETWLHLTANCRVQLTCQRCLQAVEVRLSVQRDYRFVADEASAAAADIDADEDVLASTRSLDLATLIEDELLLALPIVPRHEGRCPELLMATQATQVESNELAPAVNPFGALAALKLRKVVN